MTLLSKCSPDTLLYVGCCNCKLIALRIELDDKRGTISNSVTFAQLNMQHCSYPTVEKDNIKLVRGFFKMQIMDLTACSLEFVAGQ